VRRGDCWTALAAEFVACIYWFHPLAWWLRRQLAALAEECCDDAAIGATGDRTGYARHLLEIASVLCGQPRRAQYVGLAMARRSQVERRIFTILDSSRPLSERLTRSAALLAIAIAVPLVAVAAALKPETAADDSTTISPQTRRVRELIYLFRQHRVFSRDEEWAENIRELVEIGKPAVPELVAELDRTDRNSTLRSLGFALRAIGDRRAVPALIRAIPKTRDNQGSDCGVVIVDPELRAFMKKHQNYREEKGKETDWVACGRPVNEIVTALDKLTGTPIPHPGKGNDDRRERWLAWWEKHKKEFADDDALKAVARRPRDVDVVEEAGLAKFGPLFPTGPNWRLGPVREVTLDLEQFANGKALLDFDTGRAFEIWEGRPRGEAVAQTRVGVIHQEWMHDQGVDVRNNGMLNGVDLNAWLVEDSRWETLEDEIKAGGRLELGSETTSYLIPFENGPTDFKEDRIGTFLFTTRSGGRGIVQIFPREAESSARRLQYRMFESAGTPPVESLVEASNAAQKTPFGKIVIMTLPNAAVGAECLLDLEAGRTAALPKEFAKALSNLRSLFVEPESAEWCRERGIDVVGHSNPIQREAAAAAGAGAVLAKDTPGIQLHGRGMTALRVLPKSFYSLSIEEVRELLDRPPHQPPEVAYLYVQPTSPDRTETFAIRTSEGSIGLVKLEQNPEQPDKIQLRYRLHQARKGD
jgi:hypothetical protein